MHGDKNYNKTIISSDSGNVYLFIYFALWLCIALIAIIGAISSFIVSVDALNSIYDSHVKNLYIAILCVAIIASVADFILPILGLYKLKEGTSSENVLIVIAMLPILISMLSTLIGQCIMMNSSQTTIQIVTIVVSIIGFAFIIGAMAIDSTTYPSSKKTCIFGALIAFLFVYILPLLFSNVAITALETIQIISNILCIPMLFLYSLIELI